MSRTKTIAGTDNELFQIYQELYHNLKDQFAAMATISHHV